MFLKVRDFYNARKADFPPDTTGGELFAALLTIIEQIEALSAAQEAEAIVYSVIIVPIEASAGRDTGGEHALIQIAEDTGGKYYYATSMSQLDEAFRQISEELRTQYLLAYYPSQRLSDSSFRQIRVQVTNGGANLKVRHRAGYFTVKQSF